MYDGYRAIASAYDRFNADVDYERWSDFIEACFDRFLPAKPEIVLDLACGTGRMTFPLADRGYDMIGIDGSAEMLSHAFERKSAEGQPSILFLQQSMQSFELYGTVGAVTCCLDSLNYLLKNEELAKTFALVHNYSDPDGLFIFDVNTPYKFENVYSDNSYVLEDENDGGGAIYCGWQNFYDKESRVCDFYLSVFEEGEKGAYYRDDEHQRERCYTREEIENALIGAGFELLGVYADLDFGALTPEDERWYFVARAKK